MTTYCGVDFHARQQTICYCNTADGVIHCRELHHEKDDVRGFYSQLTGDVIIGLEASGYTTWFVELLESIGHQVWLGDATEIRRRARRRQKNDRRDAELLLDLLLREEFPQVHRPAFASREILRLLCYRHRLVQMRTKIKNGLQALAFSAGSAKRATLFSKKGRERFLQLPMSDAMELLLELQDVGRFRRADQLAAYVGLTPAQHSSGAVVRMGRITRSGKDSLRGTLGSVYISG